LKDTSLFLIKLLLEGRGEQEGGGDCTGTAEILQPAAAGDENNENHHQQQAENEDDDCAAEKWGRLRRRPEPIGQALKKI
jgi:hypothetical protein